MTVCPVTPVDRLALCHSPWEWQFACERRGEIDAYFETLRAKTPALWNGRVLLMRDSRIENQVFHGRYFETDFASLIAWRDWGFPDPAIVNSFAMAALRGSDGGFILGEMAAHTANPGRVYFAAGTPEPDDLRGDQVDLTGGLMREIKEEIGLTPADFETAPGWSSVNCGTRIAQMKLLQAPVRAAELRARILCFLATQDQPEFSDIHIVRGVDDLTAAMPPYVTSFLRYYWSKC